MNRNLVSIHFEKWNQDQTTFRSEVREEKSTVVRECEKQLNSALLRE